MSSTNQGNLENLAENELELAYWELVLSFRSTDTTQLTRNERARRIAFLAEFHRRNIPIPQSPTASSRVSDDGLCQDAPTAAQINSQTLSLMSRAPDPFVRDVGMYDNPFVDGSVSTSPAPGFDVFAAVGHPFSHRHKGFQQARRKAVKQLRGRPEAKPQPPKPIKYWSPKKQMLVSFRFFDVTITAHFA